MSDQILLDRIKNLECENSKLKARSIRWQTVVRNTGYWLKKHSEDILVAFLIIGFFGSVIALAVWAAAGWATDRFYLEFGNGGGSGACIYQEYDWGKDARVDCTYSMADAPNFATKIETIRNEWLKVKNIGREHE